MFTSKNSIRSVLNIGSFASILTDSWNSFWHQSNRAGLNSKNDAKENSGKFPKFFTLQSFYRRPDRRYGWDEAQFDSRHANCLELEYFSDVQTRSLVRFPYYTRLHVLLIELKLSIRHHISELKLLKKVYSSENNSKPQLCCFLLIFSASNFAFGQLVTFFSNISFKQFYLASVLIWCK